MRDIRERSIDILKDKEIQKDSFSSPIFYPLPSSKGELPPLEDISFVGVPSHTIVFLNGQYHEDISFGGIEKSDLFSEGKIKCFSDLGEEAGKLIGSVAGTRNFPYSVNSLLFTDGIMIDIDTKIEKPIHILYIYTDTNRMYTPRVFINVREGASVDIIESTYSTVSKGYVSKVLELNQSSDSTVNHYIYQNSDMDLPTDDNRSIRISTGSIYKQSISIVHNSNYRLCEKIDEVGDNSDSSLHGTINSRGVAKVMYSTIFNMVGIGCKSYMKKNLLSSANSRLEYIGEIQIKKGSTGSIGELLFGSLLLDSSSIKTNPNLLIEEENSKSSHGSYSSKLDKGVEFFLLSRGLSRLKICNLFLRLFKLGGLFHLNEVGTISIYKQMIKDF